MLSTNQKGILSLQTIRKSGVLLSVDNEKIFIKMKFSDVQKFFVFLRFAQQFTWHMQVPLLPLSGVWQRSPVHASASGTAAG